LTDAAQPNPAATGSTQRDHPDVLAVCRWLPQPYPWGAFTGRHDRVHIGPRHGFVNLWWSDHAVHAGEYVGPPRGGLVPHPAADYCVVMPSGGYLIVRAGVLMAWQDEPHPDAPLVRADGEVFLPESYGPARPYWLWQYEAMSLEDRRNALAAVHRRSLPAGADPADDAGDLPGRDQGDLARAISDWVATSRPPVVCGCDSQAGYVHVGAPTTRSGRGLNVPNALLRHGGAIATLAGMGGADDACDVVWNLTNALADPAAAGLVRAAEVAARRAADTVSGWPDGPLTEDAVALVAAQAVRWHGSAIVPNLPFWTLGWIFVARPIMDGLLPDLPHSQRERLRTKVLDQADRVRVERVLRTWAAANDASRALQQARELATTGDELTPDNAIGVIDLREPPADGPAPGHSGSTVNGSGWPAAHVPSEAMRAVSGAAGAPGRAHGDIYARSVSAVVADLADSLPE
jgi:hypothetical protein